MRWYVQTCGETHTQGYSWVEILKQGTIRVSEESVPNADRAHTLVKAENFSLLLERSNTSLILQITGLHSQRKNPYRGVRNSLVCIGDKFENDPSQPVPNIMRSIVIAALTDKLDDIVNTEIRSAHNDPKGFEIDNPKSFIEHLSTLDINELAKLQLKFEVDKFRETHGKVGKDSPKGREELATEIATYSLPDRKGPLIIITSLAQQGKDLEEIGTWRGLYRSGKQEDDTFQWENEFILSKSTSRKSQPNRNSESVISSILSNWHYKPEGRIKASYNEPESEKLFREGQEHMLKEEEKEALEGFNSAIALDQNNASYLTCRGKLYYGMKQYEKAIFDLNKALSLDSTSHEAFAHRGYTYLKLRQYDKAIADFDDAIRLKDQYLWALVGRGDTLYNMGRYQEALNSFNTAININENYPWTFFLRGKTYCYMGQYERSLIDFEQAVKLDDRNSSAFAGRGETYHYMEQYERALEDYDKATRLNDKNFWAFALRGETYRLLKQYEQALKDFDNAISLSTDISPEYFKAFEGRGKTYRDLRNYEKASEDFSQAFSLDRENGKYRYYIAEIYLHQKHLNMFEDELRAATRIIKEASIRHNKHEPWSINFNLALCYLISNNKREEAQLLYEQLIGKCKFLPSLQNAAMDIQDLLLIQPENEPALNIYRDLQEQILLLKEDHGDIASSDYLAEAPQASREVKDVQAEFEKEV